MHWAAGSGFATMPSSKWDATPLFYVNPTTGSDENTGADAAHALKTEAEANRRKGLIGTPDTFQARCASRAKAFTGLTDSSLRRLAWTDFTNANEYITQSRSGGSFGTDTGPGILTIVGGTSLQGGLCHVQDSFGLFIGMAGKRWYAVCRFKFSTVLPNANSRVYFEVGNTTQRFAAAGINGVTQTAKMAFGLNTNDASAVAPKLDVLSTVSPVVGEWFLAEVGYNLLTVRGSFNDEPLVTIGSALSVDPGAAGSFYFDSFPAGSGQTDKIAIDLMGLWGET